MTTSCENCLGTGYTDADGVVECIYCGGCGYLEVSHLVAKIADLEADNKRLREWAHRLRDYVDDLTGELMTRNATVEGTLSIKHKDAYYEPEPPKEQP